MYTGVDVSYWQQNINWLQVRSAGIDFAYVKATEGVTRREPQAMLQASGAQGAGIQVGYYHFSHIDADAPGDEAVFFASVLAGLPRANLMPVLDIETNKSHLGPQAVCAWITAFAQKMATLGYPSIMLYSFTPFLNISLPVGHGLTMPLWIAQYRADNNPPSIPSGWDKYTLWQYTNQGNVTGIQGNVDMNKCDTLPALAV